MYFSYKWAADYRSRLLDKQEAILQGFYDRYQQTLTESDKDAAYAAGKAYYLHINNGLLTPEYEQQLASEIVKMKNKADH